MIKGGNYMKQKLLITSAFMLALCIIFVSLVPIHMVYGADTPSIPMELAEKEAVDLYELGLFAGTDKGFVLEEIPTRLQGIIMLIRVMGEEEEARNCTYTHPFTDVPAWGDRYVAWAYAKSIRLVLQLQLLAQPKTLRLNNTWLL